MKIIDKILKNRRLLAFIISIKVLILATGLVINGQSLRTRGVRIERLNDQHKVNIYINGTWFTSYNYPLNLEKPFLYPVYAPNGSVITRGFPLEPRKGERIDHPHQIGLWFNHGSRKSSFR